MSGVNAINYYSPQIFANLGLNSNQSSLFATGVYGLVKMASCATYILWLADSLGRRMSLLWCAIAMGITMFYEGFYVRFNPPVAGAALTGAGYFGIVCIYLYVTFYQLGWGAGPWIYVSEISSARLRSLNVAFAAATQWLFNFVVARATPNMMVTVGGPTGYGTYFIF